MEPLGRLRRALPRRRQLRSSPIPRPGSCWPLPLPLQFELFAVGHCLLAAAGAFALARRLGLGARGGRRRRRLGYALAGPLLSALGLYHHFAGAAWHAVGAVGARGAAASAPARPALSSSAWSSAGQVLAGSGDLVLMTALLALGRVLLVLGRRPRPGRARARSPEAWRSRPRSRSALGAVQWLPTLERALHGFRASQDLRTRAYWSLAPAVARRPRRAAARRRRSALARPSASVLFEGREPLLAVPLRRRRDARAGGARARPARAARRPARSRGSPPSWWRASGATRRSTPGCSSCPAWASSAIRRSTCCRRALCLALLAAAGRGGVPARLDATPDRRRSRALARWLLALALRPGRRRLAGSGAARRPGRWPTLKLGRSAAAAGARRSLPLAAGRSGSRDPRLTAALLLLGAARPRGRGPRRRTRWLPRPSTSTGRAVLDRLERSARPPARGHREPRVPRAGRWSCRAGSRSWVAALGFLDTLRPPAGVRWGLRGSYDGEFTGLGPRWAAPLTRGRRTRGSERPRGCACCSSAASSTCCSSATACRPGLERLETLATPLACPLQLLRVPGAAARRLRRRPRAARRPRDALAALLDPAFDPRREVLLVGRRIARAGTGGPERDRAHRLPHAPTRSRSRRELAAPGVLVVIEAFDEGWRAEVDGRAERVLRGQRPVSRRAARRRSSPGPLPLPAAVGHGGRLHCPASGS